LLTALELHRHEAPHLPYQVVVWDLHDPLFFKKGDLAKPAGSNVRHIGKSDFAEVKPDVQGTQPG
jgi:hypothetical protein